MHCAAHPHQHDAARRESGCVRCALSILAWSAFAEFVFTSLVSLLLRAVLEGDFFDWVAKAAEIMIPLIRYLCVLLALWCI